MVKKNFIVLAVCASGLLALIFLLTLFGSGCSSAARCKGKDAYVTGSIASARVIIADEYAAKKTYTGICDLPSVKSLLLTAQKSSKQPPLCMATKDKFIIQAVLPVSQFVVCVDSTMNVVLQASTTPVTLGCSYAYDTSSWQTATNVKYALVFKYPPDWSINQKMLDDGGPINLDNFNHQYFYGGFRPSGDAEITLFNEPGTGQTLAQVIASDLSNGTKIVASTTRSVAGEKTTVITSEYSTGPASDFSETQVFAYTIHHGLIYKFILSYNTHDSRAQEDVAIFQNLLTTLKFTR